MSIHTTANPPLVADEALFSSHRRRHRSIASWLHIVIDSLAEAYTAHSEYSRQVEQGVEAGIAIRKAFGPGQADRAERCMKGAAPDDDSGQSRTQVRVKTKDRSGVDRHPRKTS